MDKTFDAKAIESFWAKAWEERGYAKPKAAKENYCIMLPPPNVTGSLHMGHGFQVALMDCLIRYQRMHGKQTLWQVGTDHAGIATQMLVERQLLKQGITRQELGREKFLSKNKGTIGAAQYSALYERFQVGTSMWFFCKSGQYIGGYH